MFVVHGGIGIGQWSLQASFRPDIDWLDMRNDCRPIQSTDPSDPSKPAEAKARWTHLHNVVWSDPSDQPPGPAEWQPHYIKSDRGPGIQQFNLASTRHFCQRNRISMIIRSHEVKECGYELHHDGLVCTVFSARNYAQVRRNDAALVLLQPDGQGHIHCKFKTLRHLN